jgi:hypothetical protein
MVLHGARRDFIPVTRQEPVAPNPHKKRARPEMDPAAPATAPAAVKRGKWLEYSRRPAPAGLMNPDWRRRAGVQPAQEPAGRAVSPILF